MKNKLETTVKKLLCAVLAAVLVLQAVPLLAYADGENEAAEAVETDNQEAEQTQYTERYYYGDQILSIEGLSETERKDCKAVYDALTQVTAVTEQMTVDLPCGYSSKLEGGQYTPDQEAALNAYVMRISQTALDAVARDYPEKFWLDITNVKSQLPPNTKTVNKGGAWWIDIKQILVTIEVDEKYTPVEKLTKALTDAAEQMEVDETDRYHTVKSIHDAICLKNKYIDADYGHDAYGGLVAGECVCEGYAKAFKIMCDKYSVPCVLITGEGINSQGSAESHMWNAVQMEDGLWYGVDVTWDDSSTEKVYYDYFLVGENTAAVNYGGKTFGESHTPNGDFNLAKIAEFTYPTLSGERYALTTEDPGQTEKPQPDESEEPLAVAYGDVDGNKSVDANDALLVLQAVVQLKVLSDEQMLAADVNGDNTVAASDALLILKKVVKLVEVFPAEQMNR